MARYNDGFAKMELQTIAAAFDNGTMTVSTAKSRVFGYLGIDIKARTKKGFLKELANYVYSEPKQNPAPKRKTAARTQKAAIGYVNRPSQITKKAPSKRLKKRRTINLQTPRGVFPKAKPRTNPVSRVKAPAGKEKFIRVELKHGKEWEILSLFPKTGSGAENAIMYAKAYSMKEPAATIRVME